MQRQQVKLWSLLAFPALMVVGEIASLTIGDSYFANKHNIFNRWFVKLGWLWTTLAFWLPYAFWPKSLHARRPKGFHVFVRYAAATLWWILFTQWCLGPPIMDRIFVLTGGDCQITSINGEVASAGVSTSAACRSTGGSWRGGHDPSGHYFLLVHSSLLLTQEFLPIADYAVHKAYGVPHVFKVSLFVLSLWMWMFLMTSIYFHSLWEKITGLAFGCLEIVLVYFIAPTETIGQLFGINELDTELKGTKDRIEKPEAEQSVRTGEPPSVNGTKDSIEKPEAERSAPSVTGTEDREPEALRSVRTCQYPSTYLG